MSGAYIYNRVDLGDGLMVTIKQITVRHRARYPLILTDLDSRMAAKQKGLSR